MFSLLLVGCFYVFHIGCFCHELFSFPLCGHGSARDMVDPSGPGMMYEGRWKVKLEDLMAERRGTREKRQDFGLSESRIVFTVSKYRTQSNFHRFRSLAPVSSHSAFLLHSRYLFLLWPFFSGEIYTTKVALEVLGPRAAPEGLRGRNLNRARTGQCYRSERMSGVVVDHRIHRVRRFLGDLKHPVSIIH